jgi:DtxR family Mn-dependent transcriptional regulator
MCSVRLAFSSEGVRSLSSLEEGNRGVVVEVCADAGGRADRLLALGVTPGARIDVLQTFPGIVFLCDQTELAIERGVGDAILVRIERGPSC